MCTHEVIYLLSDVIKYALEINFLQFLFPSNFLEFELSVFFPFGVMSVICDLFGWYSQVLVDHADLMLNLARSVFEGIYVLLQSLDAFCLISFLCHRVPVTLNL